MPSYIAVENVKWCHHFGKRLAVSLKVKYTVIMWYKNSTPEYLPRRSKNICLYKDCTQMFIAALFTIVLKCKESKCLSIGE